ncbi:Uncharacterised protein [Mycobacteroides abscessus subsp. massiliense]|nr:Uncharacterised protein [Mycobacteroides abscessus subsp. massiliense]
MPPARYFGRFVAIGAQREEPCRCIAFEIRVEEGAELVALDVRHHHPVRLVFFQQCCAQCDEVGHGAGVYIEMHTVLDALGLRYAIDPDVDGLAAPNERLPGVVDIDLTPDGGGPNLATGTGDVASMQKSLRLALAAGWDPRSDTEES